MTTEEAMTDKKLIEQLRLYADEYQNPKGSSGREIEGTAELLIAAANALEYLQPQWIPVTERLPEDGTYLCTMDGELVGQDEPFTSMCGIENGVWDEQDCVLAWMPLPEPYCWPAQNGECEIEIQQPDRWLETV